MNDIRPALIIIDMINNFDFSHGAILARKTLPIAHSIMELKNSFNNKKLPVIFVNDHYNLWQADYGKIIIFCKNEESAPILKLLLPEKNDYFR
ncbi:hypothetical protein NDK43_29060 [Neobacillus pocheonensis]|uniref:Isochorismatase family protein n=1 Tax=Neobacillus pocheonensis TaxID=363869 RepID=A0ABT0WH08_9BACI|nr:hypothetical protein [Neobacillus pocheonensis]